MHVCGWLKKDHQQVSVACDLRVCCQSQQSESWCQLLGLYIQRKDPLIVLISFTQRSLRMLRKDKCVTHAQLSSLKKTKMHESNVPFILWCANFKQTYTETSYTSAIIIFHSPFKPAPTLNPTHKRIREGGANQPHPQMDQRGGAKQPHP